MPLYCRLPIALCLLAALAGCSTTTPAPEASSQGMRVVETPLGAKPVPVEAAPAAAPTAGPNQYQVRKGDTLYAIALDHGVDYKDLARWNNVTNPNKIEVGQILNLREAAVPEPRLIEAPPAEGVVVTPVVSAPPAPIALESTPPAVVASTPVPAGGNSALLKRAPKGGKLPFSEAALAQLRSLETPDTVTPPVAAAPTPMPVAPVAVPPAPETPPPAADASPTAVSTWRWPAAGKVLGGFVDGGNKGVDIAGKIGDPVVAAAAGKVSYVGSSLRGYGKMVVIKHNADLLSVYAHNSKVLVAEGQAVTAGQKIAELGDSDADAPKLHFEIRKQGKPVNPQGFLPER